MPLRNSVFPEDGSTILVVAGVSLIGGSYFDFGTGPVQAPAHIFRLWSIWIAPHFVVKNFLTAMLDFQVNSLVVLTIFLCLHHVTIS